MRHIVPSAAPVAFLPLLPASLALVILCHGACASAHGEPGFGAYSSPSSAEEPRRASGTGVSVSGGLEWGLTVRPDVLQMSVRIDKEDASPARALADAQAAAADLLARLQQATAGAATLNLRGTKVTPVGSRSKVATPTASYDVMVEGGIEIALAPEQDYWKRSALVAALAQLADGYDTASAVKTTSPRVWLGPTRVAVKAPESYRAKLTELWVARARAFAAAAQAHDTPLVLLDCAPPGEIAQHERSLEEVMLTVALSCRIGSPKAASATPPPR